MLTIRDIVSALHVERVQGLKTKEIRVSHDTAISLAAEIGQQSEAADLLWANTLPHGDGSADNPLMWIMGLPVIADALVDDNKAVMVSGDL